jgi:hypothetical protein
MIKWLLSVIFLLFAFSLEARAFTDSQIISNDVKNLIQKVDANAEVEVSWDENSDLNTSQMQCEENKILFVVHSSKDEASSTLYYHLRKIGFLFPHPRIEILPLAEKLRNFCGSQVQWNPRLKDRGFHLHTQHPSEYLAGFMMGKSDVALDYIRWMARNMQNTLQLQLIQLKSNESNYLRDRLKLARTWGIRAGLLVSFSSLQQRSHKLIPLRSSLSLKSELKSLDKNLPKLTDFYSLDFLSFELGTSEFTKTDPKNTIAWLNRASQWLAAKNLKMFVKIHASNNQHDETYGNYNFIPQFANEKVGIEPHTVYFYGLNDLYTPFYHRQNFADMKEFYIKEAKRRPAMYFPETSYFIHMDIDAPLFLTDYLSARTDDVDWMQDNHLDGLVNFTTGQELGYWLFDYQVALLADPESRKNPYYALQLLGEDIPTWKAVLAWQKTYFKDQQLIQMLFFSNMMDEVSKPVHEHVLLKDILEQRTKAETQIAQMKIAIDEAPSFKKIKNPELKSMLNLTLLRMRHAYQVRSAALMFKTANEKAQEALNLASQIRGLAQEQVNFLFSNYLRYPEIPGLTEKPWKNPSPYGFGYLATVKNLHLWEREEQMIAKQKFSPLFKNFVDPLRILMGRKWYETFFPDSKYRLTKD